MAKKFLLKNRSPLPGFVPAFGFTIAYLSLLVLIPLASLVFFGIEGGFENFIQTISSQRVLHSYKITLGAAFIAALINTIFGSIVAWTLIRVNFPGKNLMDAIIDLPFALPTAVSGIALTTIYSKNGLLGAPLAKLGISVAFTPLGIIMAMILIGLPFVIRTLQPAIADIDPEIEEAALSLGASRIKVFVKIILPMILPASLTGFTLAFARAIGEYGSIIFIAGNMPYKTEITSLLIVSRLEAYDYQGATAIALGMMILSFILLFAINFLQRKSEQVLEQ